jgi:hypothetical protein
MKLVEGMRVALEMDDGPTCVAAVRHVRPDSIDVDLLDDLGAAPIHGRTVNVVVPTVEGLHYWQAIAHFLPGEGTLSLSLTGVSRLNQRRSHDRYPVSLRGKMRRILQGRGSKPGEVDVVDLSPGGARVVGSNPSATGDRVVLDLNFGSGPLSAEARIVMSYSDGEGRRVSHLAFTRAEEPTAALRGIARYIDTLNS